MNRNNEAELALSQWLLLLHSIAELGEKGLTRLLRVNAHRRLSPAQCLALPAAEWKRLYDLRPQALAFLQENRDVLLTNSAELARYVRAHSLQILSLDSVLYPARLEQCEDAPPPILYALGQLSLLAKADFGETKENNAERDTGQTAHFTFAVAVSNDTPPAGLELQDEIASELIAQGGIPVTGHDRLPYQRLALTAQRQNRPILYVFDRGLREALGPELDRPPFAAARIRNAVFEPERDLALSPFRLDDHGLGANNRRRDRMVFALADALIAVDVRAGGTMGKECLRAHEQGRPVFVAEGGRSGNDTLRAAGCFALPAPSLRGKQITEQIRRASVGK